MDPTRLQELIFRTINDNSPIGLPRHSPLVSRFVAGRSQTIEGLEHECMMALVTGKAGCNMKVKDILDAIGKLVKDGRIEEKHRVIPGCGHWKFNTYRLPKMIA